MTTTIEHPTLGRIRGKTNNGSVQFLGLKYATLENRLAEAKLYHSDARSGEVEATQYGPSVLSPSGGCHLEYSFIQQSLSTVSLPQSDVDGLNLNVVIPDGFAIGSNSWPQYEMVKLVQLSKTKGMPVIGVNINYRLGIFGFLTSNELRSAGIKSNNGLRDQRTALLWISKHIAGFGGDRENVTIIGQSAGGASVTLHSAADQPLFRRVVSMGGTRLFPSPLPLEVAEGVYEAMITALGVQLSSVADRIKTLLDMDTDELLRKIPATLPLMPVVDGEIVREMPTFTKIAEQRHNVGSHGGGHNLDLMIGDCAMDASILSFYLGSRRIDTAKTFTQSLNASCPKHPEEVKDLIKHYGIDTAVTDDAAFLGVLRFASDICFRAPVLAFARGWTGNAHVYHFNQPNTWEGPWKGHATHILDAAYLFMNFDEHLTVSQRALAERFAVDVITFANGRTPWTPFKGEKGFVNVYGPTQEPDAIAGSYDSAERTEWTAKLERGIGLDNLSRAWGAYMAGQ